MHGGRGTTGQESGLGPSKFLEISKTNPKITTKNLSVESKKNGRKETGDSCLWSETMTLGCGETRPGRCGVRSGRVSTYREFLERALQLLVVGGGGGMDDLLLAARRALAADAYRILHLFKLFLIHLQHAKQASSASRHECPIAKTHLGRWSLSRQHVLFSPSRRRSRS